VPHVVRLNVAPVKSLGLLHPDEIELGRTGVPGDRRFFLVDENDRMVRGAYHGPLVQVRPAYDADADTLALEFPDGGVIAGPVERGAPIVGSFFGKRPVPGRLVRGAYSDALTSFAGRPLRLVEAADAGVGTDSAIPASIISRDTVRALADLDARRFRMLIEIEGTEPLEEETWSGRLLRLGDAVVRAGDAVARCANTTHHPDTGRRDFDTLRAIADWRGRRADGEICLGIYAAVVEPGRVRVGDTLSLQPQRL
jgi:uncharacterized protein